ncbi:unnamed protein product [Enterobius vermicularis]|uniref:HP domain-containing protein n=1 Tax=Enterobius vermicularis TaxID=51028 RepID=A0A0N4V8L8_ENTVE|nr:unnamed protein product [Enterobius vermicularis]
MLIRIKGSKRPDVRLVAPKYTSLCNYGVYMLVTPEKLFFYYGKYSSLRERTKASFSITSKNGELGCHARTAENVNEVKKSEFWTLLGCSSAKDIMDDEERNKAFEGDEPFETYIAKTNLIFQVCDDYSIKTVLSGSAPSRSIMQPNFNMIFDFGSEIYIWAGRAADRTGFQKALAYAKELQQQSAPHIPDNDFSEKRPDWCIFLKMSQGLADCLFRDKFTDWVSPDDEATFKIRKPLIVKRREIITESFEETTAKNLANLLARTPTEVPLILEETEIGRAAENIFTEDINYYRVDGEDKLTKLDDLNLFFTEECYIIRWDYRVEKEGIGRLAGLETDREHDTGRQRICYFFWLGSGTTNKEQGVCALALRNFDREHQPHVRVVQGQEPFVFLSLFKGMLVVAGHETRVFLVHSSNIMNECHLEELPSPVVLRSHAAYVIVTNKITIWFGKDSATRERECARFVAQRLSYTIVKYNVLFYLIFRDTIIVDQGNSIWLWTDTIPVTQHLRVASEYSKERSGSATVICKTKEPVEFKALFPTWVDFVDEKIPTRDNPISVEDLLKKRNQKYPLEKVRARDLPEGSDLKRLEQYLTDKDFEGVFKMDRGTFYALPPWKQISLRKMNDLF